MNSNHRLENLRDEKDLLKKDVAKAIGIVESVYSEWENEKLSIPTKRIYQLSEYYEVNIDYMMKLTDKKIHIKTNNEINLDIVSKRLKEIRKSLKMTMRDLAEKYNISSSVVNSKYLILSPFFNWIV